MSTKATNLNFDYSKWANSVKQILDGEQSRNKRDYQNYPFLLQILYGEKSKSEKIDCLRKGVDEHRRRGDIPLMFRFLMLLLDHLSFNMKPNRTHSEEVLRITTHYLHLLENEISPILFCQKASLFDYRGRAKRDLYPNDQNSYMNDFHNALKFRLLEGNLPFDAPNEQTESESDYHTYLAKTYGNLMEGYKASENSKKAIHYGKLSFESFFHPKKIEGDLFTFEDLGLGNHVVVELTSLLGLQKKFVESNKYAMRYLTILRGSKFKILSHGKIHEICGTLQINLRNLGLFEKARRLNKKLQQLKIDHNMPKMEVSEIINMISLLIFTSRNKKKAFRMVRALAKRGW